MDNFIDDSSQITPKQLPIPDSLKKRKKKDSPFASTQETPVLKGLGEALDKKPAGLKIDITATDSKEAPSDDTTTTTGDNEDNNLVTPSNSYEATSKQDTKSTGVESLPSTLKRKCPSKYGSIHKNNKWSKT